MPTARCIAASAFLLVAAACLHAQQTGAPSQAGELIAVLQGSAPQHEKARACQQLAALGSREAVPALAKLLADREMGAYARSGLESIADPSAGAALRRALGTLQGTALLGVVNSLGARRDAEAVRPLTGLARGRDAELASAAISALGRIGTAQAIAAVQGSLGKPPLAAAAADALLTCADRLRAQGDAAQAVRIYERVRKAAVPGYVRLAATGRLMVARQGAGLPLLVEMLRSDEADAVHMAIATSHEMPGAAVTRALAAELPRARPQVQPSLVQALVDRGGPEALPAIEAAASASSPEARLAALSALGTMGGPSSIPVLLKAAASADANECAAGEASLARLPAKEADAAIVAALPSASAGVKPRLIALLARRSVSGSAETLLKLAADPDTAVSQAAFRALASLSRPGDMPELIRLTLARPDPDARDAGMSAVLATSARIPDVGGRTNALQDAYAKAADAATRATVIQMLGQVATYGAYRAVRSHVDDPDPAIAAAALRALAGWEDATPATVLLAAARTAKDPELRSLALRGAIRMAGAAVEECMPPPRQAVEWLREAGSLVGGDAAEKRLLLSALANARSIQGLALARAYLEDPAVSAEAAEAVIGIGNQLTGEQSLMAKSVLEALAASTKSDDVRTRADAAAKRIPGAAVELKLPDAAVGEVDAARLAFRPLFDGKSFAGWEGSESGAFRIEGGAIVGGSLKSGLARNEFLCTTRPYANFVLKAECKLINSNGGIQIRSLRVPRSSEVCGYQADMDSTGQYWGCLYDESRRGMLVQADQAKTKPIVKPNDWNAYEIRCEGPRIRLFVNGVQTADYTEKDPEILLSGIIGVQVHAGAPSETWYRNLQIAELP